MPSAKTPTKGSVVRMTAGAHRTRVGTVRYQEHTTDETGRRVPDLGPAGQPLYAITLERTAKTLRRVDASAFEVIR